MTRYRIEVVRRGRRWCELVIEDAAPDAIVRDLLDRFPADQGFRCSAFRERETRRIVEVTDQARVIGVGYSREPVDLHEGGDAG